MTTETSKCVVRQPNWLPRPGVPTVVQKPEVVEEDDMFSKGEVVAYYPQQKYGYIKARNGDEIIFKLDELKLVGKKADPEYISVGNRIGYDITRASDSLHISVLKIY